MIYVYIILDKTTKRVIWVSYDYNKCLTLCHDYELYHNVLPCLVKLTFEVLY